MSKYFSLWKQNPKSSFLKLILESSGWYIMKVFSTLQSMQKFVTGEKCLFCDKIDQLRVCGIWLKNKFPICWLSLDPKGLAGSKFLAPVRCSPILFLIGLEVWPT